MAVAPRNDFLVWAGGTNANVLTQAQYADLGNLTSGVVSGKASAQQTNKVWRQASIMAAMISKFIVDRLAVDVVDDGTIATIESNFIAAIRTVFTIPNTGVVPGTYGPTMTLAVQADGRITALANGGLTGTGITPGTYVGTTITVGNDGRITGIVGVPYGPLANANTWAQTNTFAKGVVAAPDAGFFQLRAITEFYGSGIVNDGTSTYLMSTGSGNRLGIYSGYRPFQWNMANGAVIIDGTGAGVTFGGGVHNLSGDIVANAGKLRANSGAFGTGSPNVAVLLGDFFQLFGVAGYCVFPNGLIINWGANTVPAGQTLTVAYATPFPVASFAGASLIGGTAGTSGSPPTLNIRNAGATKDHLQITNPNVTDLQVDWIVVGH